MDKQSLYEQIEVKYPHALRNLFPNRHIFDMDVECVDTTVPGWIECMLMKEYEKWLDYMYEHD